MHVQLDFLVGTDSAAMTRFYLLYTGGPPSGADMTSFASTLMVGCVGALPAVMHPDTSIESVTLTDLSSPTGATGFASTPTPGVRTGDALPAGAAVLGNYHIARRYRGGRPRGYWPLGTATDLLTRQTWVGASVSAFESAIETVTNTLDGSFHGTTSVGLPVSVSYYQGFTSVLNIITGRTRDVAKIRTGAIPVDLVVSGSVNPHVSSQRRRNLIRA
jgi:hypothetical protein